MTKVEWLAKLKASEEALRSCIGNYHPRELRKPTHNLEITAPAAEDARQRVVKSMLLNGECQADPIKRFEVAQETGDVTELFSILNRTWFGVPESTSCWNIYGFSELVELIEDGYPEDMEMPAEDEEVQG